MIKDELLYMNFLKKDAEKNPYKYFDKYFEFIIVMGIQSEKFSKDDVLSILYNNYGEGHIRISKIDLICKKFFKYIEKNTYELMDKQRYLKKTINGILNKKDDNNIENNNYLLTDNEIDNAMKIIKIISNYPAEMEELKFYLYLYIENKEEYNSEIKKKISSINHELFPTKLSFYIENKLINELLIINNIDTVKDLITLSTNQILTLFFYNVTKFNELLILLEQSIEDIIYSFSKMIKNDFDEVELRIIEYRFGTGTSTLQDLGEIFGVTRERIRQKEQKLRIKLLKPQYAKQIKFLLHYIFSLKDKPYIDIEDMQGIINNKIISNIIISTIEEDEASNYSYDSQYNFIYNTSIVSYENIIYENIRKFGDLIKIEEYNNSNNIQKRYIDSSYKLVDNCVYLKKDIPNNYILISEIKENFPKGIKLDNENYEKLKRIIFYKYDSNELMPNSVHSLSALIERTGFVLRDRATYIAEEFAAEIPDNLFIKILSFVRKCGIAPFSSLFMEYKNELLKIGIDNQYYLKGCIDKRLKNENKPDNVIGKKRVKNIKESKETKKEEKQEMIAKSIIADMKALLSGQKINYNKDNKSNTDTNEKFEKNIVEYEEVDNTIEETAITEFKTDRDAIYYKESEHNSISKMIIEKMHSYTFDFSINKLKEELPSLKNYNFANILISEQQNGLIRFDFNTYIYIDKLNIQSDFIEKMKYELKKCLDDNELHVISMNKYFIRMKLLYADMLKEYKIDNSNKMFFVAEYYLCNDFYFSKPMISSDEEFYQSQYNIICNYIRSLEKFSFDDVKEFIRIQRFRKLWSYSDLLIEMSSDFVQTEVDSMISMNSFDISNEELENISGMLDILLRNGTINTKSFKGYSLFPRLKYTWNKYLLVGIIRSFFSDKYEVENTEKQYDITDYVIRRV